MIYIDIQPERGPKAPFVMPGNGVIMARFHREREVEAMSKRVQSDY
jgi:hypothetical protein